MVPKCPLLMELAIGLEPMTCSLRVLFRFEAQVITGTPQIAQSRF